MSLTLEVEQKLQAVGLTKLYDKHKSKWVSLAKKAYAFVLNNFPNNAIIRRDDVAKALLPVMTVNENLKKYFGVQKLTQKYWFSYFVDLILDRCWADISK